MKVPVVISKGDAKENLAAKAGMESISGVSFAQIEGYRPITADSVESHMLAVSAELKVNIHIL